MCAVFILITLNSDLHCIQLKSPETGILNRLFAFVKDNANL
jgi:hypothetical protein